MAAAERGDADGLAKSAHKLKSSSFEVGAVRLGELCKKLETMGRTVRILAYPDPPVNLKDMTGFDKVLMADEAAEAFANEEPDTVVLVDCHRLDRTGPLEEILEDVEDRFCIDHHVVSGRKAALPGWVESRACSCCTLILRVIDELALGDAAYEDDPFEMTLDTATNLFNNLFFNAERYDLSRVGRLKVNHKLEFDGDEYD